MKYIQKYKIPATTAEVLDKDMKPTPCKYTINSWSYKQCFGKNVLNCGSSKLDKIARTWKQQSTKSEF